MSFPTEQHPSIEPLSPDWLGGLLSVVASQFRMDVRDAQLIKFTNNAVFRLPHARVVLRVAGSNAVRSKAQTVVLVARWLAQHCVPAVRLLPELPQPQVIDGQTVTVWHEVPNVGPRPNGADLGRILRHIHSLPPLEPGLPRWDKLASIRARLLQVGDLTGADHEFLLDQCDEIERLLSGVRPILPVGPIHGDGFLGNLISGPEGPVICDFDSTSIGPREWDLVPAAVGKLRFDYPADTHGELAASYGFDVTTWGGFEVLRRLRELQLVTSVIPVLGSNPSIRAQWQHRFNSYKSGDTAAKWTPYR